MNGATRLRPSQRFIRSMSDTPWAILPSKLDAIIGAAEAIIAGGVSASEIADVKAKGPEQRSTGGVAVMPLFGTIFPRADMFSEMSGGTSAERFGKAFDIAMNDPSVGSIMLDVDSPGGQVSGVPELAAKIFAARGKKPIVAVANHMMASAAYWIASAADEIVASPSATVGSIGVIMAHVDETVANEQDGLKVSLISAGKFKTLGHPDAALTDEGLARLQAWVDETYGQFVSAVAKHRGVKTADVRNGFGDGFVVSAADAKAQGMIDRVATFDETLARLLRSRGNAARATAQVIGIHSAITAAEQGDTL